MKRVEFADWKMALGGCIAIIPPPCMAQVLMLQFLHISVI